jgi:hypothetical protein
MIDGSRMANDPAVPQGAERDYGRGFGHAAPAYVRCADGGDLRPSPTITIRARWPRAWYAVTNRGSVSQRCSKAPIEGGSR